MKITHRLRKQGNEVTRIFRSERVRPGGRSDGTTFSFDHSRKPPRKALAFSPWRKEFQAKAKAQAQAGEAALQANKEQLESQWRSFEAQVKAYFESVGNQIEQQQATFREVAAAQAKAWREAADKLHSEATKVAALKRADVDAAVNQMKADAAEAEARLQKLKQVGSKSWTALSAALAESRKAFDQANQKAWDALRRATPPAA
jgi:hypothetical protein